MGYLSGCPHEMGQMYQFYAGSNLIKLLEEIKAILRHQIKK